MKETHIGIIGSCVCDVILTLPKLPTTAQDVHLYTQTMRLGVVHTTLRKSYKYSNNPMYCFRLWAKVFMEIMYVLICMITICIP